MTERLPQLRSLEIFVHAGHCLSFGETATAMGLSPSAVSRRIRALEIELDTALFVRHSKSISLTAAGKQYLTALSPAFAAIRRATSDLKSASEALVVTVPQSFAVSWLTPRLPSFRKQYADINIELNVSTDITGRHADSFDVGIFLSRQEWPEHHSERVLPVSVFPVCSPALAQGLTSFSDLSKLTLLHVRQLPNAWKEWCDAVGASAVQNSHTREKDMYFNDVQLAYEAALNGLGVAMGADVVVADYLKSRQLVAPIDERVQSAFSYHLVCLKSRLRDPAVQKFRRWIKASAQSA
jgi:LysR family transcriptional regulator, glycine cleavage system transcriptional activator